MASKSVWPADNVERRAVDALVPYAKNARIHSPDQIALIARSITEFGFTVPVLVNEEGGIIAGHGRVLAAKSLGLTDVPVMVARGWTEAQKRAYVIADNRIAEQASWDNDLLRTEFADLQGLGFDLSLTGFDAFDVADLMREVSAEDPEVAPPVPDVPVSEEGDLWLCGAHRVLCGDSTKADDVARLLAGESPRLMVTDPPYGVNYDADWRNRADRANGKPYGARAVGVVANDDRVDWSDAWRLYQGDVAYVWHAGTKAHLVAESLIQCGFDIRTQIVWAKTHFIISRGHYHVQHEPLWYAVRRGASGKWNGARDESTLWQIDHRKSETGHSTQKPIDCMRRPIVNNSAPGEPVYDPFLGSGTTMIAAQMEARRCFGMEINPAYADVIVERWQKYAGKTATHEDGRTFEEVRAARRAEDEADAEVARARLAEANFVAVPEGA